MDLFTRINNTGRSNFFGRTDSNVINAAQLCTQGVANSHPKQFIAQTV